MSPVSVMSSATPNGANIRKVCVPHACTGAESQVRCSIHSVTRPIPRNSLGHNEMMELEDHKNKSVSDILAIDQYRDDELRVTATVCGLGVPFHSAPASTRSQPAFSSINGSPPPFPQNTASFALHKHNHHPDHISYQFNELLRLPALWRDLPRDACIAFNVMGPRGNVIYGSTLKLFDMNGLLRTGLQKLLLHPNKVASVSAGVSNPTSADETPGVSPSLLARREFYAGGRDHFALNFKSAVPTQHKYKSNQGYGPEHEQADPLWKACLIMEKLDRNRVSHKYQLKKRPNASSRSTTAGQLSGYNQSSVPWLDDLTMKRCINVLSSGDKIDENDQNPLIEKKPLYYQSSSSTSFSSLEEMLALSAFLIIELPTFPIPIVYEESCYPHPMNGSSGCITAHELSSYYKELSIQTNKSTTEETKTTTKRESEKPSVSTFTTISTNPSASTIDSSNISKYRLDKGIDDKDIGLALVQVLDHENENDNPVEDKYRTLAHDLIRGLVDPGLKPDREQRSRLDSIISSPSHHLTLEEMDLLWRFRFTLVDNRRALTKFLLAVDWSVESEVVQAAELLEQWRKRSPIEVTDALKLLGKHVAFQTSLVRSYAIDTLAAAPDEELRLYLLQLVQALKYESSPKTQTGGMSGVSPLASFLIDRASNNLELANDIYWYIKVELQNKTYGEKYRAVISALQEKLSKTREYNENPSDRSKPQKGNEPTSPKRFHQSSQKPQNISSFLGSIGTSLRGGEIDDQIEASTDNPIFSVTSTKKRSMWDILMHQDEFISSIMDCQTSARDERGKKDEKQNHLRKVLASRGLNQRALEFNAVPLPSDPNVFVTGIVPSSAIMFKSALYPAVVEFCVEGKSPGRQSKSMDTYKEPLNEDDSLSSLTESHKVIIKTGDDLRQDQLIIMMIRLMDGILKRYTLDLCLKPYSIIATSPNTGLVEFVEGSLPISQILANHNNSIMQFFQKVAPMESAKYSIDPDVMQTYICSCAGYCVITYLLGVGDRHLDNIMLLPSGHFFHIDFGFIFGRDPKPLPPPFRLTREMVDAMGGVTSEEYQTFCSLACQAFNLLRKKSAALVLNLLHLMSDAGIEDLSNNPSADEDGVIAKVEERFRLELTDEQAESFFLGLINDSLVALAPRVMDVFHSLAVARR